MAIKGGSILHVGNGVTVIDRIQSAGPGQLNLNTEKIYELGNFKGVATIRDTPDLTFSMESLDVSTEIEAMLTAAYGGRSFTGQTVAGDNTLIGTGFTAGEVGRAVILPGAGTGGADFYTTIATYTDATHVELTDAPASSVNPITARLTIDGIDLAKAVPQDIAGQIKPDVAAASPYNILTSVAMPYLNLEQMSYRFGLRDNATQTATLRGDTIFYNPGASFVETAAGSGATGQTVVTAHGAFAVAEGDERRVLAVTAGTKRLTFGVDYTETYGAETGGAAVTTVTLVDAVATTDKVRVIYSSPDVVTYDQNVHAPVSVKPAAVRGRDIEIYVGGYDPNDILGSQVNKMVSVQSVQVDWRVTLDKDEEFGNYYAVAQDFDVPAVNGSVDLKPRDGRELNRLVRKFAGVTDVNKVVGTASSVPLPLDVVIKDPNTGDVLKRLHVPDARFTPPGYSGRVQQKLTVTVPFESDEGSLLIYER